MYMIWSTKNKPFRDCSLWYRGCYAIGWAIEGFPGKGILDNPHISMIKILNPWPSDHPELGHFKKIPSFDRCGNVAWHQWPWFCGPSGSWCRANIEALLSVEPPNLPIDPLSAKNLTKDLRKSGWKSWCWLCCQGWTWELTLRPIKPLSDGNTLRIASWHWSFLFTDWNGVSWSFSMRNGSCQMRNGLLLWYQRTLWQLLVLCGLASTALDGWVNADTRCYLGRYLGIFHKFSEGFLFSQTIIYHLLMTFTVRHGKSPCY